MKFIFYDFIDILWTIKIKKKKYQRKETLKAEKRIFLFIAYCCNFQRLFSIKKRTVYLLKKSGLT